MPTKTTGKPGPSSVDPASRGSSPALGWNTPGKSTPAKAIPGPASTGGPIAMKKALKKKPGTGSDATGAAGMIR
jgi:hypothetical protein